MPAKRSEKRYDYVAGINFAYRGYLAPELNGSASEAGVRKVLRKLVREAVMMAHDGIGWASEARGAADRIAKELIP